MEAALEWDEARDILLDAVSPTETEQIGLSDSCGRILAEDVTAADNVPPFDRSPYDGYALRSEDTGSCPVTLRILEEIPAGGVSHIPLTAGTAVKILTGAPIPPGADAVVKFEDTAFTPETVTILAPVRAGDSIVRAGEDVRQGQLLAAVGTVIDPALMGTLAAQGIDMPLVYRRPVIGIVSTGSELLEPGQPLLPGKIRNTNRYSLAAAVENAGCTPLYLGTAGDDTEEIARLLGDGLARCDAVIATGGASVGDYDLTPAAMELAGAELLFRHVRLKPGGACAYGKAGKKLVCVLSGNPSSSMTNFYLLTLPVLKKLTGQAAYLPEYFPVRLAGDFDRKSPLTRALRGQLDLSDGTARLVLTGDQGNTVLSSLIGCDIMALVAAGSGKLPAGTVLKGFRL